MLEIIYRIYEVIEKNQQEEFSLYRGYCPNRELVMDCKVCESRDHFKDIIRDEYGPNIAFRNSKKLQVGDLYCIIIGEHCYNTERYFNKISCKCDFCGANIETYYGNPIGFAPFEVKHDFFGIQEYLTKRFCSNKCKFAYAEKETAKLKPDNEQEFYVSRDMFTEDINGYIYKISKKSTGQFYVGQTMYAPVFRWGQHLKTERFPISDITDYLFEVIEIVPKSKNILEREKYWIQALYKECPEKSLNIACTTSVNTVQLSIEEVV